MTAGEISEILRRDPGPVRVRDGDCREFEAVVEDVDSPQEGDLKHIAAHLDPDDREQIPDGTHPMITVAGDRKRGWDAVIVVYYDGTDPYETGLDELEVVD